MSMQRRVFPESFKREAVDRVAASGLSAGAVARELGLHETVLRRWMTQFGAHERAKGTAYLTPFADDDWLWGSFGRAPISGDAIHSSAAAPP